MLNGLAICLLLTTLATAGVFTPTPAKPKSQQNDVIVKEGHRAVMVEYETDDGGSNTKVLISPEDPHHLGVKEKISDKAENAKDKLKETVSFILPNGKEEKDEETSHKTRTPRELVCDAYGKCKHKIASALGNTKEVEEGAKETVGNMKDVVSDKAHEAKEKVEEVSVKAKEKANGAKEDVMEKAQELKQGATEKLKKGAKDVVDSTKKVKEDVEQNASEMIEATKRKGKEAEEKLKDGAYKMKEEGKKEMKDIFRRGRGVIYDAFTYSFPKESIASSFRIMQLLGFSMAFGMSIWVTFISSYVLARVLPRQQFAMVQSKIYPLYFKAMSYSIGLALVAHLLNIRSKLFSNAAELLQGFGLLASLSMALANLWYLEPRATKVMFERMKLEKEESRGLVDVSATAEPPGSKVAAADPTVTVTRATTTTPLTGIATATATTTTMAPPKSTQKTGGDASSAAAMGELVRLSELLKRLNSMSSFLNVLTLMFLTFHLVHLGQGGLHSQLVC